MYNHALQQGQQRLSKVISRRESLLNNFGGAFR